MEVIFQILKSYWPEILAVILFLASFILQLIKKKPIDALGVVLSQLCYEAILIAENTHAKGSEKLSIAVQYVLNKLKATYPDLDVESYRKKVISMIECLLFLPQKHVDE